MAAIEFSSTPLASDADLVAYYKLENLNDSKGTKNLTNNGSVAFSAALFNNGADCGTSTGNGKYLTTNTNFTAAYNTPTTVLFWVKSQMSPATNQGLEVYAFSANPGRAWGTNYQNNGGTPKIHFRLDTSGNDSQSEDYTITLGSSWHLIGFTSDGTTLINYVDGIAISAGVTLSGSKDCSGLPALAIGDGVMVSAGGAIHDDVIIFKRVLTATEISNIYNGNWPNKSSFFQVLN